MANQRLSVVVTRRLPEAVEARLSELFDVQLRDDDAPMSRDALAAAMREADLHQKQFWLVPSTDHLLPWNFAVRLAVPEC